MSEKLHRQDYSMILSWVKSTSRYTVIHLKMKKTKCTCPFIIQCNESNYPLVQSNPHLCTYYASGYLVSTADCCNKLFCEDKRRNWTDLSEGPGNQALQHWSTVFMKKMNFIQDQETHNLWQSHVANTLSGDNVPLFWSCHQHLNRKQKTLLHNIKAPDYRWELMLNVVEQNIQDCKFRKKPNSCMSSQSEA